MPSRAAAGRAVSEARWSSKLGFMLGAVGAAVGTTNRLVLNPAQLSTALTNDPNAAANLLEVLAAGDEEHITHWRGLPRSG